MASGGALTAGLALEDALVAMLPERAKGAPGPRRLRGSRATGSRLEFSDRPAASRCSRRVPQSERRRAVPLRLEVPLAMIPMFRWLAAREAAFGLADLQAGLPRGRECALSAGRRCPGSRRLSAPALVRSSPAVRYFSRLTHGLRYLWVRLI